jgi:hypothetical protein
MATSVSNKVQLEVTAAGKEDQFAVARFLGTEFGSDVPDGFLGAAFLDWKFFAARPEWNGSRSYIVPQGGEVAAHVCAWPLVFSGPSGDIRSVHLIDWAARSDVAGAGMMIYRHLMDLSGSVLAIGGSASARRVLPKIGFQPFGTVEIYARIVRPWLQFRTRPRGSTWREAARLARNTAWSFPPPPTPGSGWSAGRVDRAPVELDSVRRHGAVVDFSCGVRTAALLDYLLGCPIASCELFTVSHDGTLRGYFLLNHVGGQSRVIDIFVDSALPSDWLAVYRLAVRAAAVRPATCEITAFSALSWVAEMLRREGFRLRDEKPVVLFDPRGQFSGVPPLHLQMVDSDAFFLQSPLFPYLT